MALDSEYWNEDKLPDLKTHRASDSCACPACTDAKALARELAKSQEESASLRQRLEETLIERDRETEVRREAEAHVRDMQAYIDRMPYPDEYDDMERQWKAAEARASQAEAALEEMQKMLDGYAHWLETKLPGVQNMPRTELQRRRSAPGQEKA